MNTNVFGWLSFIGVLYASMLYLWNLFSPNQKESRLNLHCSISKVTILTIAAHLLSQPLEGFNTKWVIWSGLGLYLIIIASGIVLMYLPEAGKLRYHARSLHPALLVGLGVSLIYHILTMLEIL